MDSCIVEQFKRTIALPNKCAYWYISSNHFTSETADLLSLLQIVHHLHRAGLIKAEEVEELQRFSGTHREAWMPCEVQQRQPLQNPL